jgi:hypothetical protein
MEAQTAHQWREIEIAFAGPPAANPYTDVDAWVIFTHDSGRQLRRPVFWDGEPPTASDSHRHNPTAPGSGASIRTEPATTSRRLRER